MWLEREAKGLPMHSTRAASRSLLIAVLRYFMG
jgi:hypothetical protein